MTPAASPADPKPLTIPPPAVVKVSAGLVGLQAIGLVVFAVVLLISGLGNHAAVGQLLGQAGYFVVIAVSLGACASALWRGRRWGRTPSVVLQVVWILVGVWLIAPSDRILAGAGIIALALVTGGLLVTRQANAWVEKFPIPGIGG